jgi:hypothetical protein
MFVPPENRSIPPQWEPPRRPGPQGKRQDNAAIMLIVLISVLALFAPVAGGTLVGVVVALFGS